MPVGPHRVWLPERGYPGLAMSRAIGDGLASLCAPPVAFHALNLIWHGSTGLTMSGGAAAGLASRCGTCGCTCTAGH